MTLFDLNQTSSATSPDQELSRTDPVLRPKCYCGAESGRAWRMRHPNEPCDGTFCADKRKAAEEQAKLH
jgi:hypothetical protein